MVYVKVFHKERCFRRLTAQNLEKAHRMAISASISFAKRHMDTVMRYSDFEILSNNSRSTLTGMLHLLNFTNGFSYEAYID